MAGLHVDVKELPTAVQLALKSLEYHCRNIEVCPQETVSPFVGGGGDGYKGFFTVIDLQQNKHETIWGSWGGANPWSAPKATLVDQDSKERPIPPTQMFLKGEIGGRERSPFATLYMHPSRLAPLLPAPQEPLSPRETLVFAIFAQIRGGCRKEYLENHAVRPEEVDSLANKGLLKKSKANSVQLTLLGKNTQLPKGYYIPSYPST